jgi:hypothetical protein
MTLFGKILVFINLVLSSVGMTWALALWTARVDWTMTAAKDNQPPGKLKELRDRIGADLAALKAPEAGWRASRAGLLAQEDLRRADRVWYASELAFNRGDDPDPRKRAGATNPARVVRRQRHLPVPDPKNYNRPTMDPATDRNGQPLLSLSAYDQQSKKTLEELTLTLGQLQEKINKDIELTDLLAGTPDRKGLQQRVLDERDKRDGIVLEQRQVRPLLVNVAVESELILRRRASLLRRIDELQRYLQRHHKVDVARRPR